MRGPLERIRRRVTSPDERPALTNPADAPTVAAPADDRTRAPEEPRLPTDAPAGLDPGALERREGVRRRGRARRRLRFLERARELLLRDLGGLVFEIHRSGEVGRHDELVTGKVQRLLRVDAEARELAQALGRPRGDVVLRTPGLGGTCPRCGELHGSEARFCSHCGLGLVAGAAAATAGAADIPEPARADEAATVAPETTSRRGGLLGIARRGAGGRDVETRGGGARDEGLRGDARGAGARDETAESETGAAASDRPAPRSGPSGGGAARTPHATGGSGGEDRPGRTEDTEVITVEVRRP